MAALPRLQGLNLRAVFIVLLFEADALNENCAMLRASGAHQPHASAARMQQLEETEAALPARLARSSRELRADCP